MLEYHIIFNTDACITFKPNIYPQRLSLLVVKTVILFASGLLTYTVTAVISNQPTVNTIPQFLTPL